MLASLTAHDYVMVGQTIAALRKAKNARPDDYRAEILRLFEWLERCGFATTKATAENLRTANLPEEGGVITPSAARELEVIVATIGKALEHESNARQVIALETGGVSKKLRNLGSKLTLSATQNHLLDETIRCLECAAYRSAAVMGWNLAYDRIRRWMWEDTVRRGGCNRPIPSDYAAFFHLWLAPT